MIARLMIQKLKIETAKAVIDAVRWLGKTDPKYHLIVDWLMTWVESKGGYQ